MEGTGLHHGQFSGQPGRNTLTPVIMEELKNEISHASCKSLVNFDNDAASCYDHIIPALTSLIGRKHRIHQNIVFMNVHTHKEAKYKLKHSLASPTNSSKIALHIQSMEPAKEGLTHQLSS
jgi:hypothetical protein